MRRRRVRVLLVHSIPTPYRLPLFRRLAQEPDIDLTVFFMSASASNRVWQYSAELPASKVLPGVTINLRSGGDTFPIWMNPTIATEIWRNSFDVVICAGWDSLTTPLARLACLATRTPFILWAGSTVGERSWRRTLMALPVRVLVRSADACIAYGTAAQIYLHSLGARQIFISYNTVDVETFECRTRDLAGKRQELKRALGIHSRHVVIYVGQLIVRKGVLTLAKALRRLDRELDVAMVWVGYGPLRDQLQQLAREHPGIPQYFETARTVEEVSRYYGVADVSVVPSDEEVWGLVVNESLASGVPVITTTAVGAARDLVRHDQNGFVVPPGNESALVDILQRVLADDDNRVRLSTNARLTMHDFTYEQNVTAWRAAIAAAVGPRWSERPQR